MKIDILTLFPEMFEVPMGTSMMKKARDVEAVEINIHNLRKWTKDKHKTVDGRPFGGGKGMVLMIQPIYDALKSLKSKSQITNDKQILNPKKQTKKNNSTINHQPSTILLSPQGRVFNQAKARELSKLDHIILIAGHYEGFDERIREHLIDEELSIGEYVLTGGELPAMVVTDAIVRLLPGVLAPEATENETFSESAANSLQTTVYDYPTYTRPIEFKGWKVPKILTSGNHAEIEKWRKKKTEEKSEKVNGKKN